jgi:hypothetical protein
LGDVKHDLRGLGAVAVATHTIRDHGKMVAGGPVTKNRRAILLLGAPTNVGGQLKLPRHGPMYSSA